MYNSEIVDPSAIKHTKQLTVALLGNPNSGKTTVFNQLTGLRQKVGNFPGVTVDKKIGKTKLSDQVEIEIVDLPGTYSFYPTSQDERIVVQTLYSPQNKHFPDAIIYIANVNQLEKHLLLFSQVLDLNIPVILALNMTDQAEQNGLEYDTAQLSKTFKVPVINISGRTGLGMDTLKQTLIEVMVKPQSRGAQPYYHLSQQEQEISDYIRKRIPALTPYQALLVAHHNRWLPNLQAAERIDIAAYLGESGFDPLKMQVRETMDRYNSFQRTVQQTMRRTVDGKVSFSDQLDYYLTHRIIGPIVFFVLMLFVFQAIFAWAAYPMDWIDMGFSYLGEAVSSILPEGWLQSLLVDGILAGLGGILVFVPQIAILFFLVALLEEVGYMARVVFLFDNIMQRFGLNGRSVVALISGGACAVPAIMSTRTISNWKERLITIMVTPLISCSARIPVYAMLIGFVVPATTVAGIFNLQGLAFMGLYLLGIASALIAGWVFKMVLPNQEKSFLLLELPIYRSPSPNNVFLTVFEKVKTFILEAGKIILVISMVLWVLSSFGPSQTMANAEAEAIELANTKQLDEAQTKDLIAAKRLEASFAGHIGKTIEPVIKPLGFDWKIGIALLTSFAAREVFIGTMATIYSIGSEDDTFSIRDKLAEEKDPVTGEPVYNAAVALSLLLFYVFAMQCMSTLAIVKRETKSWKWPIIQFVFMTALAYLSSLTVYQIWG